MTITLNGQPIMFKGQPWDSGHWPSKEAADLFFEICDGEKLKVVLDKTQRKELKKISDVIEEVSHSRSGVSALNFTDKGIFLAETIHDFNMSWAKGE